MKTEEVEKLIKRKFQPGKSLQEQVTPDEWAAICFESEIEIEIEIERQRTGQPLSDAKIAQQVRGKFQKILSEHAGNHQKALNSLS
jgi:hypothetical protein